MKQRRRFPILILAVVLAGTASLTGCRVSPALRDTVYSKGPVDTQQTATEQSTKGQDKTSAKKKGSGTQQKQEKSEATYDTNAKSTEKSQGANNTDAESTKTASADTKVAKADSTSADIDNSGTGNKDASSGTGKKSDSDAGKTTDSSTDNGSDSGSDSSQDSDSGDGNTTTGGGSGATGTETTHYTKTVTDGSGTEQTIPENVVTVTAVGPAASAVEMLGGSGRLIASSESFTSDATAKEFFGDISKVSNWWSDDGDSQISDADFQKLLDKKPQVCFGISGEDTFSSEQIEKLEKAGIGYLVLPAFTSTSNIESAVKIIASALGTNTDSNMSSTKIAQNYCDWADKTISDVDDLSSDVSKKSLYISEWRDDISFQRRFPPGYVYSYRDVIVGQLPESSGLADGKGSGVAITWSRYKAEPLSAMMAAAGVTNTGTNTTYSFPWTEDYVFEKRNGIYVLPYYSLLGYPKFSSDEYTEAQEGVQGGSALYHGLGSDEFPALIVANKTIKQKIESNYLWQYHSLEEINSEWLENGHIADGTDKYENGGYIVADSGMKGNYSIYVSPTGIDSWADGSVETPLESYWVANRIGGVVSDSALIKKTKEFYKQFFGATLSDSEIKGILNLDF